MNLGGPRPPRPIPLKDRSSFAWVARGRVDVEDGAFVVADEEGVRTQFPVGAIACVLAEPGTVVTHAAITLAARVGTLFVWTGEGGVRLYASGQPGSARSERILHQARLALDDDLRLRVVRRMYAMRFGEDPPARRSVDQLRGLEAMRVKEMYRLLAARHGVRWHGRSYDPKRGAAGLGSDAANICISAANACLYGLCEAAIIAAGYAPSIGFLHTGKARSFVFDIGDLVKFETVTPAAFAVAAKHPAELERITRLACRDVFRKSGLLRRLVPLIEDVLTVECVAPPAVPPEALPIAFENEAGTGDAGHRG